MNLCCSAAVLTNTAVSMNFAAASKKLTSASMNLHAVSMNLAAVSNQRTNGPVNAHLRSAAYTNKHV